MIIETSRKGRYLVWNKNLNKTRMIPMFLRLRFNKHTNELEYMDNHLFSSYYSIEELKSMLKELERVNKEYIKE